MVRRIDFPSTWAGHGCLIKILYLLFGLTVCGGVSALAEEGWPIEGCVIFGLMGAGLAVAINRQDLWLEPLSAWLYITRVLKVRVTYSEARSVAKLFVPNETGKWWPMKEVSNVPKDLRRAYFLEAAHAIMRTLDALQEGEKSDGQDEA